MIEEFIELGLKEQWIQGLGQQGIETPTEIQKEVIPLILENKDVVGESETGTGKTLAYLLPMLQKMDLQLRQMQGIILVPTHELAIQIQKQIELLAKNTGLAITSAAIIGNVSIQRQIEKLKEKPHIIVGSAGRILELIGKKKISAHTIKTIVIDEADRLLDVHNIEAVKAIIKATLRDRQLLLFSATISKETEKIAEEIMKTPSLVRIQKKKSIAATISHLYFVAEQRDKILVLRKIISSVNPKRAIVFINNPNAIDETVAKLKYHRLKAAGIYGTAYKEDRKKAMDDFRSGRIQLLVASDIGSRGLDIEDVTHVINLDLPEDPDFYLHRAGRTGRAGKQGTAISIVTESQKKWIQKYEKVFHIQITPKQMGEGKIKDIKKTSFSGRNKAVIKPKKNFKNKH